MLDASVFSVLLAEFSGNWPCLESTVAVRNASHITDIRSRMLAQKRSGFVKLAAGHMINWTLRDSQDITKYVQKLNLFLLFRVSPSSSQTDLIARIYINFGQLTWILDLSVVCAEAFVNVRLPRMAGVRDALVM